jgi:hypothetical protein
MSSDRTYTPTTPKSNDAQMFTGQEEGRTQKIVLLESTLAQALASLKGEFDKQKTKQTISNPKIKNISMLRGRRGKYVITYYAQLRTEVFHASHLISHNPSTHKKRIR